jgi:hypothetical protein
MRAGDLGVLGTVLIRTLFFFPFLLSFSMHFSVIWRRLASPHMSPRRLEGGVPPRLTALKTMVAYRHHCKLVIKVLFWMSC